MAWARKRLHQMKLLQTRQCSYVVNAFISQAIAAFQSKATQCCQRCQVLEKSACSIGICRAPEPCALSTAYHYSPIRNHDGHPR